MHRHYAGNEGALFARDRYKTVRTKKFYHRVALSRLSILSRVLTAITIFLIGEKSVETCHNVFYYYSKDIIGAVSTTIKKKRLS